MKDQILSIIGCHDCGKDITYSFIDKPMDYMSMKPIHAVSSLAICQNCMESYLIFYAFFMKFSWAIDLIEKEQMLSRQLTPEANTSREWRTAINIARGLLAREEENELSS